MQRSLLFLVNPKAGKAEIKKWRKKECLAEKNLFRSGAGCLTRCMALCKELLLETLLEMQPECRITGLIIR